MPSATSLVRQIPSPLPPAVGRDDPQLRDASEALERGDHAGACAALSRYVEAHPDSREARVFFAEVLFRLGKAPLATVEFERAIAKLQAAKTVDLGMIVHCHGRLIDLAEEDADEFHIHLHRGLGLYWLAQQKGDAADVEPILCKAVVELSRARAMMPHEARPHWYLHLCWRQLGQTAPAAKSLNDARDAGSFTYLTPCERNQLLLRS